MAAAIQLYNLSLAYGGQRLLSDVSLNVVNGNWLAVLGRSGCGKSTFLKAIAGLNHGATQTGHLRVNGNIAYMAQQDSLLPWLNAVQNVELAPRLHKQNNQDTQAKAHKLLGKVGLAEHANKAPYELSGGQRQRVALARTLMQTADIILMDEPFSAVDAITRLELQCLSAKLLADKTVILITHDPAEAVRLADVIYVMITGCLSEPLVPQDRRPRLEPHQAQPELQQRLLEMLS